MEGEIIYKKLCAEMARRGGRYPGMDIPEFYDLARELFTPEEAAVAAGMGTKPKTAQAMATEPGKGEQEMKAILETATKMEVHQVRDHAVIQPNCVYVIAPDRELFIEGDGFVMKYLPDGTGP